MRDITHILHMAQLEQVAIVTELTGKHACQWVRILAQVFTRPCSRRRGVQPCCIASCALTRPEMVCGSAAGHDTKATVEGSTAMGT